MTDLEQFCKDVSGRLNNDLKTNPKVEEILKKYSKIYPEESLGMMFLTRFNEEEKQIVLPFFLESINPLVEEFMAEENL